MAPGGEPRRVSETSRGDEGTLGVLAAALEAADARRLAGCFGADGVLVLRRGEGDLWYRGRDQIVVACHSLLAAISDQRYVPGPRYTASAGLIEEGALEGRPVGMLPGGKRGAAQPRVSLRVVALAGYGAGLAWLTVFANQPMLFAPLGRAEVAGGRNHLVAVLRDQDRDDGRVATYDPHPDPASGPVDPAVESRDRPMPRGCFSMRRLFWSLREQ